MTATSDVVVLVRDAAARYGLDPVLVCAVIEQESKWNQWLNRYEPAFEANPKYGPKVREEAIQFAQHADFEVSIETEVKNRCMSFGLMQQMGQAARELGFAGPLVWLCDPYVGTDWGCKELAAKLREAGGDVARGLELWNGGANASYAAEVLARFKDYQ